MATKGWILKVLFFIVQMALCSGNAKVQVRFDKYSNPNEFKEDGHCCDGELRGINCTGTCDYSARVCLGSSDETPCDLLSVDTGAFELSGNGDVKFVSGRPNPVLFDLPTWTGSVFITLQILDLDTSASENVDKFSFWYSLQSPVRNRLAGPSDYMNHTLIGQRKVEPTSLSVSVNVMCDRFYYSDNCSVNCVSSDDCNGHYDCDTTTGERTCLQGWGGSACSVQLSTDHGCNKDQVCYHGSTCVPYDNKQFYYCCCAAGYTGINCETDVDECASQPCHNGGNCSQGDPGKYECQCPLRYKGRNCEESKTCADNPCLNNGNCSPIRVATTETFYCSCPPGFTGGLCESVITTTTIPTTTTTTPTTTSTPSTTTSLTSTMSTPAVCSEDLYGPNCSVFCRGRNDCTGHYSCNRLTGLMECLPGWRGANCSSKTQPDPGCQCQNGGECFLDTCCCPDNFTGLLCQTPVSYCRAGRCLNGGTCYEEASGFQCACAAGFTGERCEKAVCPMDFFGPSCAVYCKEEDSCETGQYTCHPDTGARVCRFGWRGQQCSERDPAAQHEVACPNSECRNNGICANNTCCCRPGFTGSLCHIEILECASSPCQNGARCQDLIADYRCECRRGFAGKNCESRVEPTPSDVTSPVFDPCYGVTCFNKGTCVNNGTAESICLCLEGFSGKFCQDVVSHMTSTQNPLLPPCQKNYYGPDCTTFCKEEHSCDMGHYYCDPQSGAKICRNGWSGPQCLTRIVAHENDPECPKGIPCLNEGSCSNGTCCCRQGFSGTYCEVEELHCARSPCLNGRCQDLQNGYKCQCNQGYDGIHCENFTEISNTTTVPSLATEANVKETIDVRSTPNTSPGIETNPVPSSSPVIETTSSAGVDTSGPGSSSEKETRSVPDTQTSPSSGLIMATSSGSSSSSGIETSSSPRIETTSIPGIETSSKPRTELSPTTENETSSTAGIVTSSTSGTETSSTPGIETSSTSGIEANSTAGIVTSFTSGIETSSTSGIETSSTSGIEANSTAGIETSSGASFSPGLETGSSYGPGIETTSAQGAENSSILVSGSEVTQEMASVTSVPAVTCGSKICYNGGTCFSFSNGIHICLCQSGFEGDQCEVVTGLETSSTTRGVTKRTTENAFLSSSASTSTEATTEKTGILIGMNISTERSWAQGVTELASPSTVDVSSRSDPGTPETTVVTETTSSNDSAASSVTQNSSSTEQTTATVSSDNSLMTQPGGDHLATTSTYDKNTSGGEYNSTRDIFGVDTSETLNNATVPPYTSGTSASENVFQASTSTTKPGYDSSPGIDATTSNGTVTDSASSVYPSSPDGFRSTLSARETGLPVNATSEDSSVSPQTTAPTTSSENETMIVTRNITGGVSDAPDLTSDRLPSESNFVHGQTTSDYIDARTSGGTNETTTAVGGDTTVHPASTVKRTTDENYHNDGDGDGEDTTHNDYTGDWFSADDHSVPSSTWPSLPLETPAPETPAPETTAQPTTAPQTSAQPTTEETNLAPGTFVNPIELFLIGTVKPVDESSLINIVETVLNQTYNDVDCCVGTKKLTSRKYIGPDGLMVQMFNIVYVSINYMEPRLPRDQVLTRINQDLETTPPFSRTGIRVYTGPQNALYPVENKYEIEVVGDLHIEQLTNITLEITSVWRTQTPDCQCKYEVIFLIAKSYIGDYGTKLTRLVYFINKDGKEVSSLQTKPPSIETYNSVLDNQKDSFKPVYEGNTSVPFDRHYTLYLNVQLKMVTDAGVTLLEKLQEIWLLYLKASWRSRVSVSANEFVGSQGKFTSHRIEQTLYQQPAPQSNALITRHKVDMCSPQKCTVSVRYTRPELFLTDSGYVINSLDYFVILDGSPVDPTKVAGPTPDDFENAGVPLCRCVATPLPYDDALGSLTWSEINSYVNDLNKHENGSAIAVSRQSFLDSSGNEATRFYYASINDSKSGSPPLHDLMNKITERHKVVLPQQPLRRQFTLVLEDVVTEGESNFLQTYLRQAWEIANNGGEAGGISATKSTTTGDWKESTPEGIPGTALSIKITSVDSSYLADNKSITVTVVKYTVNVVKADSSITIAEEPSKVSLLQGFQGSSYIICACVPLKPREIITSKAVNPDNTSSIISSIEKAWKKENPNFTGSFTFNIRDLYVNHTGTDGKNITRIIYTVLPNASSPAAFGFSDLDLQEPSNKTIKEIFGEEPAVKTQPPSSSKQFPWWIPVGIVLGLLLLIIIILIFLCIIRDLRRRESRNIKQKPEHINGYDREHFSSEPAFDNPSFAVDDPDLNDSKSSTYFVNVVPDQPPQPNDT